MNDMRNNLIDYMQSLVDKRSADNMPTMASNLVGSVSRFKPLKQWIENNVTTGHDLKSSLLNFIYENKHYFTYDPITGHIINNHYLKFNTDGQLTDNNESDVTIGVLKPKMLFDLELNYSLDSFDDNLLVFELIVFIFNEIVDKEVILTDLIQSVENNCQKPFLAYQSWIGFKDRLKSKKNKKSENQKIELDINYNNESVLIHLITELKPFFSYDLFQRTVAIDRPEEKCNNILNCLLKTSSSLIRNFVSSYLYRFGRKLASELTHILREKHPIVCDFVITKNKLTIDKIIAFHSNQFITSIEITSKRKKGKKKYFIDLNSEVIGKDRRQEFDLLYEYGNEITGRLTGRVSKVKNNWAIIETKLINDKEFCHNFIVDTNVSIYGQSVEDLNAFLHFGDRLAFDVCFIADKSLKYLWFVSRIYNVKHTLSCFLDPIIFDNWDNHLPKSCSPYSDDQDLNDSSDWEDSDDEDTNG